MKFSNLSRRINALSAGKSITQEDVLGLMSVICDDVRFEGVPVDRCPVQDSEQLIDELYALSYTINILYQSHKKKIMEAEQTDSENELWQQLREAERACADAKNRSNGQDAALEQLKKQEAELRNCLAIEREKQNQAELYRAKVAAMEQELESLRKTDLHPLTERYAALEKEQADKQALLARLHEEMAEKERDFRILQEELQCCHARLAAQQQDQEALEKKLEETRSGANDSTHDIARLRQLLAEAEKENGDITTEFVQVRAQLEAQQSDNEAFRTENLVKAQQLLNEAKAQAQQMNNTLSEFTAERETIGAQISQIRTIIEAKKMDLDNKKQQLADRNAELERLNDQLSAITADIKPLLDEINMRKERLEDMDREQIESDLRRNLETWQAQVEDLEKKQRQCAELQEQITAKSSLVASEREKLEGLTAAKLSQDKEYEFLCQNVETLDGQLGALKAPEYLQRVEKLQRQQSVLLQLRTNLEQGNRAIGCGWSFDLRQDLDQRLTACGQALKELQKAIQDYASLMQANLNQ